MKSHLLRSLITAASLSAALVGTASATQWNFDSLLTSSQHNTSLGSSYTFIQGSAWMQATALVQPSWTQSACSGTTSNPCLYAKFTSSDPAESGLGLKPADQNEVNFPDGIGLMTSAGTHISSLTIGSVQTSESWSVEGCSATFSSCVTLDSGVGGGTNEMLTINGLSKDAYASFVVYVPCQDGHQCDGSHTNGANNILLLSATTVPEPGVLALFGAGLLGCALVVSRRRRASQFQA